MTSHRQHRCEHCLTRYYFQASGHGAPEDNHDRYCPECYRAVQEALAKVPRKFERVWIPTTEVTLKQLQKWDAENNSVIRRVGFPLFRIGDDGRPKDAQVVRIVNGRGSFVGRTYEYRHWMGEEDKAEILIEVERDLQTGKTEPWMPL